MYEQSVSHCPINVTWFPFDDQHCYLIYEPWKYNSSQLNITGALIFEDMAHYEESEQWELLSKWTRIVNNICKLYVLFKILKY